MTQMHMRGQGLMCDFALHEGATAKFLKPRHRIQIPQLLLR